MMSNYGYLVFQAERAKTQAEQRAIDDQLGRRTAAVNQLSHSLAQPARVLRRWFSTSPSAQPACSAVDCGC
jgi:hypothetical protein